MHTILCRGEKMVGLVCLVFCSLLAGHVAAQECVPITDNQIATRIEGSSIPFGSTSLEIIQKNTNCVAVGVNAGTHRFVTVTANVTYLSPQLQNAVFQVDVPCISNGTMSEWSTNIESRNVTNETEIGLLLSAETRSSCSSCSPLAEDALYHCQGNVLKHVFALYVYVICNDQQHNDKVPT